MDNEMKVYERIIATCSDCGKEFIISPAEQKYYEEHNLFLPKRCFECRTKRRKVRTFTCVDCNKEFSITETNAEYYEKNGLQLPKRCPNCIEDKKRMKEISDLVKKELEEEDEDFF